MNILIRYVAAPILGFWLASGAGQAVAADVRVLGTGAVQHSVVEAIALFEKDTGHKIMASFGTAGAIGSRIDKGEAFDLVLSSSGGIRDLAGKGFALLGDAVALGRVRIAIGVKAGAPKLDVGTPDRLKAALLAAPSFAYGDPASGATTGIHFAKLLAEMGIADAVKDKALLRPGGLVVMKEVADGKAQFGVTQASEILAVPGTEITGYLPDSMQLVSTYAGQVGAKAREPQAARQFLDFLAGPKGREIFKHHGFDVGG